MILLKSPREIARMEVANRIVAETLEEVKSQARPGVTTEELNEVAEACCRKHKVKPAFKGYRGYSHALCTSVNEEVVHGIPGPRQLKTGDLVSLDFGVLYDGFFGDAAITFPVGEVTPQAQLLMKATEESLYAGIAQLKVGGRLSDISHAVQTTVEGYGFGVVRQFVGHGIGRSLHEDPQIPNFGPKGRGPVLKPGMTVAIEPMTSAGSWEVTILEDGWTAVTADHSLSAHFEHTVALTEKGVLILSRL
ncbi:MAG: type I methionyl aminopeptidase [Thermodesulfobacteriota bacterium]